MGPKLAPYYYADIFNNYDNLCSEMFSGCGIGQFFFFRPGLLMTALTVVLASNKTIVRAGRLIGFPVFGWMIVLAFCFLVLNMPNRRSSIVSPFARLDTISSRQVLRTAPAWRTARPCFLMIAFMISAFFIASVGRDPFLDQRRKVGGFLGGQLFKLAEKIGKVRSRARDGRHGGFYVSSHDRGPAVGLGLLCGLFCDCKRQGVQLFLKFLQGVRGDPEVGVCLHKGFDRVGLRYA